MLRFTMFLPVVCVLIPGCDSPEPAPRAPSGRLDGGAAAKVIEAPKPNATPAPRVEAKPAAVEPPAAQVPSDPASAAPRKGSLGTGPFAVRELAGPFVDDRQLCTGLRAGLELPPAAGTPADDAFTCKLGVTSKAGKLEVRGLEAGIEAPVGEGLSVGFAVRTEAGWFAGYDLAQLGESVHGETKTLVGKPVFSAVEIGGTSGVQVELTGSDTLAGKPRWKVAVRATCAIEATTIRCSPAFPTSIIGSGEDRGVAFTPTASLSAAGQLEVRADTPLPEIDLFHWPAPTIGKLSLRPS